MGVPRLRPRVATPVTNPTFARYLDDLRRAEQAAALDVHFGRVPPRGGMFDNIDLPDDPLAAQRAVGAPPRSWLERGELARSLETEPSLPMVDMLLENDKRRALLGGRLDRLTPEQQARSLPAVGRQYEADQAAARAADIRRGRDMNTAGMLAAGGLAGAGAFGLRMAMEDAQNQQDSMLMEAWENEKQQRMTSQLSQDPASVAGLIEAGGGDSDPAMDMVSAAVSELDFSEDTPVDPIVPYSEANTRANTLSQLASMFGEEPQLAILPDSPDDAIAAAPGPTGNVRQVVDLEDLPGPQKRSIIALIRGGIPEGRAMDIILKGSSMSPDEYRMVTGGRR
jgi:hypothetical protein